MLGMLRAELLKVRRRPAVWVCFAILMALVVFLGYLLPYLIFTHTKPPATPRATIDYAVLKQGLYPLHFHQNSMNGGSQLGGVLALIIGVLVQGSEYGWSTVKTVFTQGPRRWQVLAARLAVLSGLMLLMAAVLLGLGALTSAALAGVDGRSLAFPDAVTIVKAVLAMWLVFDFWALFGFALATLFQQSALAIGLGLAYALVIEALIFGLADQFVGTASKQIHQWFPLNNMTFLVRGFGPATGAVPEAPPFAGATHGAVVLLVYCATLTVISLVLTQRRDVT